MCLNINDINDDSLISVFNFLSVREKIAIERVCKRWQQIICDLLGVQKGIKMATIPHWMKCHDSNHSTVGGDVSDYLNYTHDKYKVKKIVMSLMRKCHKLKCIEISWSRIEFEECTQLLSWFLWLCPNLECIRLFVNGFIYNHGFGKGIEIMGDRVIHFAVYQKRALVRASDINLLLDKIPALTEVLLLGFQFETMSAFEFGIHSKKVTIDCVCRQNIDAIVRCKKMESLEIFGALNQLEFTQICNKMTQLSHLTLRFKESVDDFSALNQIKSLQSFGISNINYYDLRDISSTRMIFMGKNLNFPDLKNTINSYLTKLSYKKLVLNNLRSFSLYGICIEKNMLNKLGLELPHIQELILNKCGFLCECHKEIVKNCNNCQRECALLLSKWPKLSRFTFDHPENQILINNLNEFNHLRNITINHIRLHPNNRFYLDDKQAWTYCEDIFKSCFHLANKTKDQIDVNLNIFLDNIITINFKTPKNLRFNFNYFSF